MNFIYFVICSCFLFHHVKDRSNLASPFFQGSTLIDSCLIRSRTAFLSSLESWLLPLDSRLELSPNGRSNFQYFFYPFYPFYPFPLSPGFPLKKNQLACPAFF